MTDYFCALCNTAYRFGKKYHIQTPKHKINEEKFFKEIRNKIISSTEKCIVNFN